MLGVAFHLKESTKIFDYGNISTSKMEILGSSQFLETVFKPASKPSISLFLALAEGHIWRWTWQRDSISIFLLKNEKLGIINLMPTSTWGQCEFNSGAILALPFFELSQEFPNQFHYLCLGFQRAGKSPITFWNCRSSECALAWAMEDFNIQQFGGHSREILAFLDLSISSIWYWLRWILFCFCTWSSAPSPVGIPSGYCFQSFWIRIQQKIDFIWMCRLQSFR